MGIGREGVSKFGKEEERNREEERKKKEIYIFNIYIYIITGFKRVGTGFWDLVF